MLCVNSESLFNLTGRIGGNSDLSETGHKYAVALEKYFAKHLSKQEHDRLLVWTSTLQVRSGNLLLLCCYTNVFSFLLQRTISTAKHFAVEKIALPTLDEIDAGVCDGMTYDDIAREMPEEFAARAGELLLVELVALMDWQSQPTNIIIVIPAASRIWTLSNAYVLPLLSFAVLAHRYHCQLEPVLLELERIERPVLVISHQAITRVLLAYFQDVKPNKIPYLSVP